MEEMDSLENLPEENGVRKQTGVVRRKRQVKDIKGRCAGSSFVLFSSFNRRRKCTICVVCLP